MDLNYVGRCPGCKRVVAACAADEPGLEKETARWVAGFIKKGLIIEQMNTEQVRVTLQRCVCPKNREKKKQLELSELGIGQE